MASKLKCQRVDEPEIHVRRWVGQGLEEWRDFGRSQRRPLQRLEGRLRYSVLHERRPLGRSNDTGPDLPPGNPAAIFSL